VPLAAGCLGSGGGGGGGVPAATERLPAGARVAPASARAFISFNTESGTPRSRRQAELYRRLAGLEVGLFKTLASGGTREVGSELDLVFLPGGGDVVWLARPRKKGGLEALLKQRVLRARRVTTADAGGWTILADSRNLLDRFLREARVGKLADDQAFRDSMGRVDAHDAARVYLKGGSAQVTLDQELSRRGAPPLLSEEVGTLVAIAFGARAEAAGIRLDAIVRISGDVRANAYTAQLPQETPAGAILYVSFNHLDLVLKKVLKVVAEQNSTFEQQLSQVTAVMDITLNHDVYPLLSHEGAIAVYQGRPLPKVALVLRLKDVARAKRVLGRLVTIAELAAGASTRRFGFGGVRLVEVDLSHRRTRVFAAVFRDELAVTNDKQLLEKLIEGKGAKLSEAAAFRDLLRASKMPQRTLGFVYGKPGEVQSAVGAVLGHVPVPVTSESGPRAIAYVTREGDRYALTGFVTIK